MNGTTIPQDIRGSSGWLLALGIIYVIMGFFIIGTPVAATLAIDLLIGIVLIIGGLISIVESFLARPALPAARQSQGQSVRRARFSNSL